MYRIPVWVMLLAMNIEFDEGTSTITILITHGSKEK